ncbi:UNKNOWN [Stylonychia lemnae]|uniref:Pirin n=1 Tax=Stylonychia lemnae TaxID=5949 RepID=A0A078B3I7_STYLE|nr:UNKNOWN [Stylonychia lemnae]|eukprot:CDW88068.1 UNKNOWN [Stylonychia lemnae]
MENQGKLKQIQVAFTAKEQPEGDGARVRRFIGVKQVPTLDPFLMLDWFNVKLPAGFPDHPHRGFETVTYLMQGEFFHEDFKGHKGKLGPGDIQWMTAGKGIVHSEMPASFTEAAIGFQLWINLDSSNKFCNPRYQEFKAESIPVYKDTQFQAKVISGQVFGVKGPIEAKTPTYFLDFFMDKGKIYSHAIPAGWNAMVIVHNGSLKIQDSPNVLSKGDSAQFVLNENEEEYLKFESMQDGTGFVLLAGKPINEPVVWRGPFVLNTQEELKKTFSDYSNGKNGFEGSNTWESGIKDLKFQQ